MKEFTRQIPLDHCRTRAPLAQPAAVAFLHCVVDKLTKHEKESAKPGLDFHPRAPSYYSEPHLRRLQYQGIVIDFVMRS